MTSNDRTKLIERVFQVFIRPGIEQAIEYLSGNLTDIDYEDLCTQKQASREFPLSQPRIAQLIKSKRIGSYTELKLVRRSEIRIYLDNKAR